MKDKKHDPGAPLRRRVSTRGERAALARKLDVRPQDITNWLARGVPQGRIPDVAHAFGLSEEEYRAEVDGVVTPKTKAPPPGHAVDSYNVPIFEVTASMGPGALMPDHDTVVDHMRLTRTWLQRNVSVSAPQNLAVISAYGDSMAPTFNDGDILLVDRGVAEIKIDAVYVLSWQGELFIKRVQRQFDGSVSIISDNKVYTPVNVKNGERKDLKVLGRVLWAWNGRKL